jgi:cysteine desulfurase
VIVYLDHATAPILDTDLVAAMNAALACGGSADARHPGGIEAAAMLEHARAQVADLIGGEPDHVIFTAGATESRNLAVKGLLAANRRLGTHAVASAVEHPAVMSALRSHVRDGGTATFVDVDDIGRIRPGDVASAMGPDTALVSVHHAQHEIGTIQDLVAVIAAVRAANPEARIHVDAGESLGVLPLDVSALGADAVTIGGAALGAPAWTGALWVRPGARLYPLVEGGSQEAGKRAGPVDLPGAVALGWAAERTTQERGDRERRLRAATSALTNMLTRVPEVRLNGPPSGDRLPGHLQVSVRGVTGESLALALATRGVFVAPGSTCTADAGKASPTLAAIGCGPEWTHAAILMTLGTGVRENDVDIVSAVFADAVTRLRAMSPIDP